MFCSQLFDPTSQEFYPLDGLVPVDKLGLYLYRAIHLSQAPLESHGNLSSFPSLTSTRSSPSYLACQFIICRVRVADGQKQLIVQSQVIVQNSLSDHLGLEIMVQLPSEIAQSTIDRPRIIIPPMSSRSVPVFGK